MNASSIRYIPRAEIEIQKWDQCISNANNGLVYAFSFYLDKMSDRWDALVMDDYRFVMPLTWNKKAGIHYLYQPPFTPSLGVFGNSINAEIVNRFIQSIPAKFRFVEINLNTSNELSLVSGNSIETLMRKNYILPLHSTYDEIYNHYSNNIKRNIKRSISLGCTVRKDIRVEDIIDLAKDQLNRVTKLESKDFENFYSLYQSLASKTKAVTYGIFHKDQLLSAAAYFFSHNRAYYILVGNHPNGKTMGTSHYLVDRFIADHAGTDLVLDFEGSDISSLAFFYSSFGAEAEHYPALKINRLPWYVKWLK